MKSVKAAAVTLALLLAPALLGAEYRIVLRGGITYWTKSKPAERNGAYVFTATDGTLLSVRKRDVASIAPAEAPRVESTMESPAEISPVDAARHQRALAKSLRDRPKNMPQNTDAYRPGVGVPYPAGANDYLVGKTYAPPPGSAVYSGAAPSETAPTGLAPGDAPAGVPSGDAPQAAPPVNATTAPSAPPPPGPTPTPPPTEAPPPTETAPAPPPAPSAAPAPPPAEAPPPSDEEPPPPPAR